MLTNRYLEYSKNITKEIFKNICKILQKDSYDSSFDIDTMWEFYTNDYPYLTRNRDVEEKWLTFYSDSIIKTICTPITVEEIFKKGEELILKPFKSFKGGIKVEEEEDLELIKKFLLFLCPENPSEMNFFTNNGNVYYLYIEKDITLSIKCETYYNRKTIGPILNIYDAISSYVRDGYSLPEEFFKDFEKITEKRLREAIEDSFLKNSVNSMGSMLVERPPITQDLLVEPLLEEECFKDVTIPSKESNIEDKISLPKEGAIIFYGIDKNKFFPEISEIL